MQIVFWYILLSVVVVSLVSLVGIFTLSIKAKTLKGILIYFLSFAAGALLGDVFLHILPELGEKGFELSVSIYVLFGLFLFFVLEKVVHWQHCHMPVTSGHKHPLAVMNLVGDGIHNLLDGMIIAASYLVSLPLGIATTLAVLLHEIPQEIGDFGILLHAGYSRGRALLFNLLSGFVAIFGALMVYFVGGIFEGVEVILSAIAAGGFIYIASSDLIPELHKEVEIRKSLLQALYLILGIIVVGSLLFLE